MRKSYGWELACLACLGCWVATAAAQDDKGDGTIVQTHFLHKNEAGRAQEVKVIIETSPPEVVTRPGSGSDPEPRERCCLFRKTHRTEGRSTVGSFIFTPAVVPLGQGAGASSSNLGATADLSGLRSVHELEARLAAFDALQAAQEREREHTRQALGRLQQNVQGTSTALGASAPKPLGASGTDSTAGKAIADQLKVLNERLDRLETLVLKHQETLRLLVERPEADKPAPAPPPAPEQLIPKPRPIPGK